MASSAPESTTCFGWLWLATTTASPNSASTARTSPMERPTAVIAPGVADASRINSPRCRATATRAASSITPAAHSAVISPKLCPPTCSAFTPTARSTRKSARLATPMAGWAHSVAVSRFVCAARSSSVNTGRGNTTSPTVASSKRAPAASSQTDRAASSLIATSPPMPTYWLPCPGKTNATGPTASPTA